MANSAIIDMKKKRIWAVKLQTRSHSKRAPSKREPIISKHNSPKSTFRNLKPLKLKSKTETCFEFIKDVNLNKGINNKDGLTNKTSTISDLINEQV